VKLYIYKEEGI